MHHLSWLKTSGHKTAAFPFSLTGQAETHAKPKFLLLLMVEILHHLTCMKPCKQRNIYHINCLAGFLKHQQVITHPEKHTLAVGHISCFVPRLLLHTTGHVWSLLRAGSVDNYTTLLWHGNLVYATGVIKDPREFAVFCIARTYMRLLGAKCWMLRKLHIHVSCYATACARTVRIMHAWVQGGVWLLSYCILLPNICCGTKKVWAHFLKLLFQ